MTVLHSSPTPRPQARPSKHRFAGLAVVASLLGWASASAQAQTVTLKVHHHLSAASYAHTQFIKPWCDKIAKESNDKLKCQIYPSMQLGGAPKDIFDQVKDGVADVGWTLPGYLPGRFPLVEVFELPFMMQNPEATSKALWDYVGQYAADEFKDVRPLAFHMNGDAVFHMVGKPIKSLEDLKGLKVRAPTRQSSKYLSLLGATPVPMPIPAVGEALAKGVIDGAIVPYEVVPAVKIQELVKFHSETDATDAAFAASVFLFAMNKAKYDSLPADLKKVIDANSGQALSGQIGKTFLAADAEGKKLCVKNTTNVIPREELRAFKKAGQALSDEWVADVGKAKGVNGKQLLDAARSLITKHAATP